MLLVYSKNPCVTYQIHCTNVINVVVICKKLILLYAYTATYETYYQNFSSKYQQLNKYRKLYY